MQQSIEELITIKDLVFKLKIYYENRSSSRVSIRSKNINIRISKFISKQNQINDLEKLKAWAINNITKNYDKFAKYDNSRQYKTYNTGDIITIAETNYTINISFVDNASTSKTSKAKFVKENNLINLFISNSLQPDQKQKSISNLISRIIAKDKLAEIKDKINYLNQLHFKSKLGKITLKNNSSNWGSCSHKNNINISSRLLLLPASVQEYVQIHELAHTVEKNHSERFWNLVEKIIPDYKQKRKWLRENGNTFWF
ncbi:MAG: M48 family metallopeptidase [archaeon]